jgi:hypothetical protein
MAIGIKNIFRNTAAQAVTSSIVPVDLTGLAGFTLAASQEAHVNFWVPFTLGATGGFRWLLTTPAVPTYTMAVYTVMQSTTPTYFVDSQTTLAAFANASAVAAEYMMTLSFHIVNGTTAGLMGLQFAQENATGNPITVLRGAYAEVSYF